MASTLSHRRRPAHFSHRRRRRRAQSLQTFLISGLVAAALLAIAGVTTLAPAVTDAVRGSQAEIVPPTGDLPPIPAAAYVVLDGDTGEPLASYNADRPNTAIGLLPRSPHNGRAQLAAKEPEPAHQRDLTAPRPEVPHRRRGAPSTMRA